VNIFRTLSFLALTAACVAGACAAQAQQTAYEQFRGHNAAMKAVQPSWMAPLIQTDCRLSQAVRVSYSNAYVPGAQIMSYGNGHGVSVLALRRFQFDFDPPAFFRNHSAALKDGFGNAGVQLKYRIASGNEEHGNYALTAVLYRNFTPGSSQNGMLTGIYDPKIAVGKGFGRWFDMQTTLSGMLPTGKVALQGRAVEWNVTAQVHPDPHWWVDVENNATFNRGGPFDGATQNFLTPAAFYLIRRKDWAPTHPIMVIDGGMQIATSQFRLYNHNLIAETRILF
jgi:hypothetical protein